MSDDPGFKSKDEVHLTLYDFMKIAVKLMDSVELDLSENGVISEETETVLDQLIEKYDSLNTLLDAEGAKGSGEVH